MGVLRSIIEQRKQGIKAGIPSYCTANKATLGAIFKAYKDNDRPLLIESTANQVDQFGGYTGMRPKDFRAMVFDIAADHGFDTSRIILGGDHLGPLTFCKKEAAEAMALACELVRVYCLAGYKKIHLDTSMRLGDDDPAAPLAVATVAERGAMLFAACLDALKEAGVPRADWPEFVIGSEVPVPGGAAGESLDIEVTSPASYLDTVEQYKRAFAAAGLADEFDLIAAVVVQLGVEYGDHEVAVYDHEEAAPLMAALRETPDLMFEGHSTDYQPLAAMRRLVEDGVGILKVGPMVTNAYRQELYALAEMEKWLIEPTGRSNLIDVFETTMTDDPKYWLAYYPGTETEQRIAGHFSLSDRIRYYLPYPAVERATAKLFENLKRLTLPASLVAQYAPAADAAGLGDAESIVDHFVAGVVDLYESAVS